MFKALLRSRFSALLSTWSNRTRTGGKARSTGSKLLWALLMVYLLAVFLFLFGAMFDSLCAPLFSAGLGYFYFAVAGITATAICFIGTVFMAQSQLFEARDNDLLLAMPIPPAYILASRLAMLYLLGLMDVLLVLLPAGVIYALHFSVTAAGVGCFVLICLLLPLLGLVLSCLVGWLVALVSARMRRKNLITTVLSLALMGGYFYFYSRIQSYLNALIANGAFLADAVRRSMPPFYQMGMALCGDAGALLYFALWMALPFAAAVLLLSRSFVRITTLHHAAARVRYRARAMRANTPRGALIRKELRHFSANAMYMLNAALGLAFMVAMPVALLIKHADVNEFLLMMPPLAEHTGAVIALALCLLCSTVIISAPSVSLEGKNLWIVRSAPLDCAEILHAKADIHLLVSLPFVVCSALLCLLIVGASWTEGILAVLLPAVITFFMAELGVTVNLAFPRLDYINEVAAVKSSVSTILVMLSGMVVTAVPVVLCLLLWQKLRIDLLLALFLLLMLAAALLLRRYNATRGAAKFAALCA